MSDFPDSVRSALRRFDPLTLSYLGLFGFLGYLSEPLEPLRILLLFFLFSLWPLVSVLLPSSGGEEGTIRYDVTWRWRARYLLSSLLVTANPFVLVQSSRQIVGYLAGVARYRGRPPAPDRYAQRTDLALPFEGEWAVANGGPTKETSHSWGILSQRYAYDFLRIDAEGRTHEGDGTRAGDYYCYDEPILAPADGVVVSARDGRRDSPYFRGTLDPLQRDIRGNSVTIRHAENEYGVLAHLREGSVEVDEGDRVVRGQRIGRCGHSGNSTEPHLHFQLQDGPDFLTAAGLPVTFGGIAVDGEERADAIRGGQRVAPL